MIIDPEFREVDEPIVTIAMSRRQAEAVQGAIADILCWCRGFMAGKGDDAERYAPIGIDTLREMNSAMKRAIEQSEKRTSEQ